MSDIATAWQDVADALPEGWYLRNLRQLLPTDRYAGKRGHHWRAQASRRSDLGLPAAGMVGIGPDAETALWRLADLLSGLRR